MALPHHDHQHEKQAEEGEQGTRERRDRIEPIVPFQVSFHPAHMRLLFDATFRR